MKKRLFPILLAIVMSLSLLPVSAMATTDVDVSLGRTQLGQITRTLEMNDGIDPYMQASSLASETVQLTVGQTNSYQRLPTWQSGNVIYAPKSYGVIRGQCVDVSDPEVVGDFSYSLEYKTGTRNVCLQFNYTAKKVGTATITLEFFFNYGFNPNQVINGDAWWRQTKTITVKVVEPQKSLPSRTKIPLILLGHFLSLVTL